MGDNFAQMMKLTCDMTLVAGDIYFAGKGTSDERREIYEQDIKVNKLQRTIRKQVIAHLSIHGNSPDLPYCLFLLSLVKDVERMGDYAKNLTEVSDFHPHPLPDDDLTAELSRIRARVEAIFRQASDVFRQSDRERAMTLIQEGRDISKNCDALITRIAEAGRDGRTTAALVLGTRYYKRVSGHLLNVLSSVVMPLHKLDYFDEDEMRRQMEG
jgi:phosphate uptake regulator